MVLLISEKEAGNQITDTAYYTEEKMKIQWKNKNFGKSGAGAEEVWYT